jgi:hypothetical protein
MPELTYFLAVTYIFGKEKNITVGNNYFFLRFMNLKRTVLRDFSSFFIKQPLLAPIDNPRKVCHKFMELFVFVTDSKKYLSPESNLNSSGGLFKHKSRVLWEIKLSTVNFLNDNPCKGHDIL